MPLGVLLSAALLRAVHSQSGTQPGDDAMAVLQELDRRKIEQMDTYVMDVLVKGEWQEMPMGTTVGSIGAMNNPSPNRLRVRLGTCEDSRRQERQAQEMQLLRGRVIAPAMALHLREGFAAGEFEVLCLQRTRGALRTGGGTDHHAATRDRQL